MAEGYIQHNLAYGTGREAFVGSVDCLASAPVKTTVKNIRAFEDGDKVFLQTVYNFAGAGAQVAFDIFRMQVSSLEMNVMRLWKKSVKYMAGIMKNQQAGTEWRLCLMFSKILTMKSTVHPSDALVTSQKIDRLKNELRDADAVLIGAGAGLSTAAGLTYSGERFRKYFSDFADKYGIRDMYSGGFYPFDSMEEYWSWWSRHIWYNRYQPGSTEVYKNLYDLVKEKDYFVLTTNVDHQFQLTGFDKKRLFYMQGDFGLWQCSEPCHQKTYDNEETVRQMIELQKDMKVPTELIPHCPVCGRPMSMNLRCDDTFVQDNGWYEASEKYRDFVRRYENLHILYLELGVGGNTPGIIKYPFWRATAQNEKAVYACINYGEAVCPKEIAEQSICIDEDIKKVLIVLG